MTGAFAWEQFEGRGGREVVHQEQIESIVLVLNSFAIERLVWSLGFVGSSRGGRRGVAVHAFRPLADTVATCWFLLVALG